MRLVFMGTPDFALPSLQALLGTGHQVVGVFTQPDRPRGRGKQLSMSPVKELALQHSIPVFQPNRIRTEGVQDLVSLKPDACVTAAFGQILSQQVLDVPPLGTINVHASLLPRYRGSAPINWAIIKGETITGVTTMMTNAGIDTGDILLCSETPIGPDETAGQLSLRLAILGADLLVKTLDCLAEGTCRGTPQQEEQMSYYPMLSRQTGAMDWSLTAVQLHNLVRGLNPWPAAYCQSPWGKLKVLATRAEDLAHDGAPGSILVADVREGLLAATGQGALRILTMQAPGGKAMAPQDFLRGHPLPPGGRMQNGEMA